MGFSGFWASSFVTGGRGCYMSGPDSRIDCLFLGASKSKSNSVKYHNFKNHKNLIRNLTNLHNLRESYTFWDSPQFCRQSDFFQVLLLLEIVLRDIFQILDTWRSPLWLMVYHTSWCFINSKNIPMKTALILKQPINTGGQPRGEALV